MIEVYTDGACRGNGKSDAVGGWGFYLLDKSTGGSAEFFGGEKGTTNNKMELQAAIEALKYIDNNLSFDDKMRVKIYTDSNYVYQGITTWINGWIRKGWKDVKNVEQWKELMDLNSPVYTWNWVKAHQGNEGNEIADLLANKGCNSVE